MSITPQQRVALLKQAHDPWQFPAKARITRLDGSIGGILMREQQSILMSYFVEEPWTYLDKYRQAMSSIIHVADQLRHVMFTPGNLGMTVGDKEDTYKELMRRQGTMYNSLDEHIRYPLERPVSSENIAFAKPHEGYIQGITGGGENPAVGFSPDYAVISEYGLFSNYAAFDGAFFPAIERRPNAKCRIETTPGTYNSPAHEMYKEALKGKGLFCAIFLSWWRDMLCIHPKLPMPDGWSADDYTPDEKEYAHKLLVFEKAAIANKEKWYRYKEPFPIQPAQMWFRRKALETHFHGDPRLFDAKYPPSPHEGWLIGTSPTIPAEPIQELLRKARKVTIDEEFFFEEREKGCPYLLTVDGAGYGKTGDPSAMTLWNMWDWREAGSWSGREDPGMLALRIKRWQERYDCDVIIEVNKGEVSTACVAANVKKLYWANGHPGWYSTKESKDAALVALVNMLRNEEVDILSDETIDQLGKWDGKTRSGMSSRAKHHFDRAITCLIFAFGVVALGHVRRPKPKEVRPDGPMTAMEYIALFAKKKPQGRVCGD